MANKDECDRQVEEGDAAPFVRMHRAVQELERTTLRCLGDIRRFRNRLASGPLPWYPTITVEHEE